MKKKIKTILIMCIIIINADFVYAHNNFNYDNKKDAKKETKEPYIFMGGSLWFGFGSYTFFDINYIVGSQLTKRWNVGLSGKYQYYNDKRSIVGNFQTSVYGGSVFTQFAVINDFSDILPVKSHGGLIAHAEYELLNTEYNYLYFENDDTNRSRYWLQNVLVGGGYNHNMGRKVNTYIIILWNLTQSDDNPYTYPQIKIGFSFAL